MGGPVFEVRQLTKTYHVGDVDVHALRDVSLTLPEGEFVVLLGPPAARCRIATPTSRRPTKRN
jgi:ABC-type Fe3+/spermidine/putrescine transport system ATPase subunit